MKNHSVRGPLRDSAANGAYGTICFASDNRHHPRTLRSPSLRAPRNFLTDASMLGVGDAVELFFADVEIAEDVLRIVVIVECLG